MSDNSNEEARKRYSMEKFGHPNASWSEITDYDNEQARKRFSMERFGHPNASWSEINAR